MLKCLELFLLECQIIYYHHTRRTIKMKWRLKYENLYGDTANDERRSPII